MGHTLIALTCPRCGHAWHEDVRNLAGPERVIYRDAQPCGRTLVYRVPCPHCGTYVVVTLAEEPDDA